MLLTRVGCAHDGKFQRQCSSPSEHSPSSKLWLQSHVLRREFRKLWEDGIHLGFQSFWPALASKARVAQGLQHLLSTWLAELP